MNYKYRMHDPRIGRFFAIDPLSSKYPHYSPYSFSGNRVIDSKELEGLEPLNVIIDNSKVPNSGSKKNIHRFNLANPRTQHDIENDGTYGPLFKVVLDMDILDRHSDVTLTCSGVSMRKDHATWYGGIVYNHYHQYDLTVQVGGEDITIDVEVVTQGTSVSGSSPIDYLFMGVGTKLMTPLIKKQVDRSVRNGIASQFYKKAGYTASRLKAHVLGIDLDKDVTKMLLEEGTEVTQWVGANGVGSYFTTVKNGTARNLGIGDYDKRTLKTFTLTEDVEVLKSTAGDLNGNKGGGTQFFSPEIRNKSTEVKP